MTTHEREIAEFYRWRRRAKAAAWVAGFCFLALFAVGAFTILRGEDTRGDTAKTQQGVDRASRTIQKLKQANRRIDHLTRRLNRNQREADRRFDRLLALLQDLGIDTSPVKGTSDATQPSSPTGAPSPMDPGGNGSSPGGGEVRPDPPGPTPPPPGPPNPPSPPEPPSPPQPPAKSPSVGGLGVDVPVIDECRLAPIACE